jgi:hypothetical protein
MLVKLYFKSHHSHDTKYLNQYEKFVKVRHHLCPHLPSLKWSSPTSFMYP